MRGKDVIMSLNPVGLRITPAYAGKSLRKTAVRHSIKDHPRLCGEKILPITGRRWASGITPAYAGKSDR